MLYRGLGLEGWLEELAHGQEVVNEAGNFAGLLLDEVANLVVGVEVLLVFLMDELVGEGL